MQVNGFLSVILAGATLVVGCSTGPQLEGTASQDAPRTTEPKRMVVASREESTFLIDQLGGNGDVVEELVSAGLVRFNPVGDAFPVMAEAVPAISNNLVKLLPDGRMETTWTLKEGMKWQDGAPLTTDDLLFAVRVGQDKDLPDFGHAAYGSLDRVRAVDARTIVAEWKQVYIQYDRMFSWQVALPLPKHLLEDAYLNRKEGFTQLPYWVSNQFMHAGPYRVREFVPGERLMLEANPNYALGRPKLDEVEVRFIPDANTLIANVISGEVLFTLGSNFVVSQAKQAAERWPDGKMEVYPFSSVKGAAPQFINPDPPVQLDARFRRALAHAFDREAMNDVINLGTAPPPANIMMPVSAPEFPQIKDSVVDYPYDPRRAAQLIEEIGYTRVGDFYRDASGKELSIDYLGAQGGAEEQAALFMLDSWRRVGVNGTADLRASSIEREVRATRPGLALQQGSFTMSEPRRLFQWFHGSQAPTAENRFRGNNVMRYVNPEFDGLVDRYFSTIETAARIDILKQVAHHLSDNEVVIVTYHVVFPALINNRVKNATPRTGFSQAWDNHLWDVV
jgi:peptide/nickel transport system substrate-binding protein